MSGSQRPTPRLAGLALRTLAHLSRTPPGAAAARAMLRRELGIDRLRKLPSSFRGRWPLDNAPLPGRPPRQTHDAELGPPSPGAGWPVGLRALAGAFAGGQSSPLEVAKRAIDEAKALAGRTTPMGPIYTYDEAGAERDAAASTGRYQRGTPLGPLDGMPLVVSESTAVAGLPARMGTACMPSDPSRDDATVVARLRRAGAVVLGASSMTERGMSALGINPQRRLPRNPHAEGRLAGGSSTGAAVAVATGLSPLAVASDAGGAIRVPSALCGVFGLKPTWGRVSRAGDGFSGSLSALGPIAAAVEDLAWFLEEAIGPDEADPESARAPVLSPGALVRALGRGVRGVRIGVLEGELEAASPPAAQAARDALSALEREGATLVSLRFDFARYATAVGYVLFGVETLAETRDLRHEHHGELGPDVEAILSAIGSLPVEDVTDALLLRSGLRAAAAGLLRDVDVLALPTTAVAAPTVSDDDARGGLLDPQLLDELVRFSFLANLTGLPAATAPVGVDEVGLPLGLQIVGDAHDEATVLAVLAHLERTGVARVRRPRVAVDLLGG